MADINKNHLPHLISIIKGRDVVSVNPLQGDDLEATRLAFQNKPWLLLYQIKDRKGHHTVITQKTSRGKKKTLKGGKAEHLLEKKEVKASCLKVLSHYSIEEEEDPQPPSSLLSLVLKHSTKNPAHVKQKTIKACMDFHNIATASSLGELRIWCNSPSTWLDREFHGLKCLLEKMAGENYKKTDHSFILKWLEEYSQKDHLHPDSILTSMSWQELYKADYIDLDGNRQEYQIITEQDDTSRQKSQGELIATTSALIESLSRNNSIQENQPLLAIVQALSRTHYEHVQILEKDQREEIEVKKRQHEAFKKWQEVSEAVASNGIIQQLADVTEAFSEAFGIGDDDNDDGDSGGGNHPSGGGGDDGSSDEDSEEDD